jgi:hypothetical protein
MGATEIVTVIVTETQERTLLVEVGEVTIGSQKASGAVIATSVIDLALVLDVPVRRAIGARAVVTVDHAPAPALGQDPDPVRDEIDRVLANAFLVRLVVP